MKLNVSPRANLGPDVADLFRKVAQQVNSMAEGRQGAFYTAYTAAPTTGTYAKGDFILNSNPSELGSPGSKYLIHGWRCSVGGTPGTWLQCRYLTGN